MSNVSKRKFLKSAGLCTILAATGNIHDGLSFLSPISNKNDLPQLFASEPFETFFTENNRTKVLCIEVGDFEFSIGNAFLKKSILAHYHNDHNFNFIPITHSNQYYYLNELLAHAHAVFFVGSIYNRDFWVMRDLILTYNIALLCTVIPSNNDNTKNNQFKPAKNEAYIPISKKNFVFSAIKIIQNLSCLILVQGRVGLDFADIKSALVRSNCVATHIDGSLTNIVDNLKVHLLDCKRMMLGSKRILYNILSSSKVELHLNLLTEIVEGFSSIIPEGWYDCQWGIVESININTDIEITILFET